MVPGADEHLLLRLVEGISGTRDDDAARCGCASSTARSCRGCAGWTACICAIAGPDALALRSDVHHRGREMATVADFEVRNGESLDLRAALAPVPPRAPPARVDVRAEIDRVEAWWASWMSGFTYDGHWQDAVRRSVITLKGLTYAPTGGIVAAATTSLPEQLGGVRNWDYRFCWLRDATITLIALTDAGFVTEAQAWREWLLRAIAGDPVEAADHVRGRRASAGCPSGRSPGSAATRARLRYGSATRPSTSSSSTSTAR